MHGTGPSSAKSRGARISSAWLARMVMWSSTPASRVRSTDTQPSPEPSVSSSSERGHLAAGELGEHAEEPASRDAALELRLGLLADFAGDQAAVCPPGCGRARRRPAAGR